MTTMKIQDRNERIQAVRLSSTLNGIESLEITSVSQKSIRVYCVHPLPGRTGGIPAAPVLTKDNIRIEGGVRVTNITVTSVNTFGRYLQVHVDKAGDFSRYSLKFVTSPFDTTPPAGFDPVLSSIEFSFKVQCPNDFDCCTEVAEDPAVYQQPSIDYLAKDYRGFRRLMLNRMSTIMPQWLERNPADQHIMLTEVMAYIADQFSYYQDAVATEAYLGTSRLRRSLKRHTSLVDYRIHDGCNARAWVHVSVVEGSDIDEKLLPKKTPFTTRKLQGDTIINPDNFENEIESETCIFESLHGQKLYSQHNSLKFYTWSGSVTELEKGATSADIYIPDGCFLESGDVIIIEEIRSPITGDEANSDREKRWAVRLINVEYYTDPLDSSPLAKLTWHQQDALPFDLCLETTVTIEGTPQVAAVSHVLGNIILVDHGTTVYGSPGLSPSVVIQSPRPFRPVLTQTNITYSQKYNHFEQKTRPARNMLIQNPSDAQASVWINDGENDWIVEKDLLGSDRFNLSFVVESEFDGSAHVRFGDDTHGKKPPTGTSFTARFRIGNGPSGNVGAESISRIVTDFQGIQLVRNPISALGGILPESAQEIKRNAPEAFKVQKRAVTEADWERAATLHPEVQKARACFRWTGSWYTVFIAVDRMNGLPVLSDSQFCRELLDYLDRYRIMGYDLELRDPVYTSLEIILGICVKPGFVGADIHRRLKEVFSSSVTSQNQRGFFHPDNMTFGKPVYLSEIYAHAHSVEGVSSVLVQKFQRWGKVDAGEIAAGVFQPAPHEIARCSSDPSFPEHGLIQFEIFEV